MIYLIISCFSNRIRKLLLPTSSEDFKVLEEGPLRVSVEVDIITVTYLRLLVLFQKDVRLPIKILIG